MNKVLNALYVRLRDEPILTRALVAAIIVLLVQAGLPISPGLADAITGLVVVTSAFLARRKVTPVAKRRK